MLLIPIKPIFKANRFSVDKWARKLGKDLNDLGLVITKAQEIEDV